MRVVQLHSNAIRQLREYATQEPKLAKKTLELIEDVLQHPFEGLGKPEALKHELGGFWSRRISDEHRLVYKVTEDAIIIIACKTHYQ